MFKDRRSIWTFLLSGLMVLLAHGVALAGEADIVLPDLSQVGFLSGNLQGITILNVGLLICVIGMIFGIICFFKK